jgi:hypothetical protein
MLPWIFASPGRLVAAHTDWRPDHNNIARGYVYRVACVDNAITGGIIHSSLRARRSGFSAGVEKDSEQKANHLKMVAPWCWKHHGAKGTAGTGGCDHGICISSFAIHVKPVLALFTEGPP